jgi:hypothetical protein
LHGLSAAQPLLNELAHAPPVPTALPMHVSHASPEVFTPPFAQYSVLHEVLHGPLVPQAQAWMIFTRSAMPVGQLVWQQLTQA